MTKHQVIGIYGVSGSGKSTLLARLKQDIVMTSASFYEGSSILASLTGTIKEFQSLSRKEQDDLRTTAIQSIDKSLPSIVTGHYSFPTRDLNRFEPIMTEADKKEFTHVIYLNTAASQVFHRSINKHGLSIYQIQKWIDFEIIQLEAISSKAGIKFISVGPIIDYDVILKTVQEILGISSVRFILTIVFRSCCITIS